MQAEPIRAHAFSGMMRLARAHIIVVDGRGSLHSSAQNIIVDRRAPEPLQIVGLLRAALGLLAGQQHIYQVAHPQHIGSWAVAVPSPLGLLLHVPVCVRLPKRTRSQLV